MFLKSTPSCKGPPKNKKNDMRIIILCLSFMTSIQLYIDVVIATRQGKTESNTTSTNKKKLGHYQQSTTANKIISRPVAPNNQLSDLW